MREIKFRARVLDIDNYLGPHDNHWVKGEFLTDGKHTFISPVGEWSFCSVDAKTVGEFTGLKDKNGVEIYEGDIIDFNDLDTDVRIGQEARDWRAKVVYNSFGTRFVAETFKPYWGGNKQFYQEYTEVIGNIYENPELLEAKS